jgi:hypothetical protein
MNKFLALIFFLTGCSAMALDNPSPPTGEEFYELLLNNANIPLSKEPNCDVISVSRGAAEITLGQHVATILSVSYQTKNTVKLGASCEQSKHDAIGGAIDVWDCKWEMNEENAKGEFISSAIVAFSVSLDKAKFIQGSLRCF